MRAAGPASKPVRFDGERASGPLWSPSPERAAATRLAQFLRWLRAERGIAAADYTALHRFSIEEPGRFWSAVWDFAGVVGERAEGHGGEGAIGGDGTISGTRFFPGARLNFAENLLHSPGASRGRGDAVVFRREDRAQRRLSWDELRAAAGRFAGALSADGLVAGDRVAAWLPNLPEGIAGMLGATSLGAVWASCSPDFGVEGVLDRFGQIEPRVLLAADGYLYGGRRHDCLERLAEIRRRLPSVERVVLVPYTSEEPGGAGIEGAGIEGAVSWAAYLAPHPPALAFHRLPFDHPLYILFSSGTTGPPKCIVHRAGGILLKHLCELQFQVDVRPGDRVFYFSTLGWMMWNWLASALASGATILLYDGSPVHPDPAALWDYAAEEGMTLFGTSARYLDTLRKAGYEPRASHALEPLRTLCSTGSPLAPESFEYVYRAVKGDLHLASISGGTDLCGGFVAGDPTGPVHRGEIQAPGLGMAVEVFDADGRRQPPGRAGELVCTRPFPSVPLGFWNDPDGGRFRAAYFERFPGAWHHGDWITETERGGFVIHGRSDATLNPGGVRIGTAEIYRQVDGIAEVAESLAIGQQWEGDVRVILFVRLRQGAELDDALCERLRRRIREHASPRHVPAKIVPVADLPRTRSGKLVELAVRDVVHGRPVKNREALANPEALELFSDLPELAQ
jgi:acetoacetyl-CoA synthetase